MAWNGWFRVSPIDERSLTRFPPKITPILDISLLIYVKVWVLGYKLSQKTNLTGFMCINLVLVEKYILQYLATYAG